MDELLAGMRAIAETTRLRLLFVLSHGEFNVSELTQILGQSQPKVSRHLAYLRRAGVVIARREGKWMHYSIEHPPDRGAAAILDATLASFASDRQMQADLVQLGKACCRPQRFVTLQDAPIPVSLVGQAP